MLRPGQLALLAMLLTEILSGSRLPAGVIEGHVRAADPAETVIWVDDIEGSLPTPRQHVVMEQKGLRFVPHVLAIRTGTTVEFPNLDPLAHNVFSISDAKRFNLGLYANGVTRQLTFDKPGVVELLCNVHSEMSAYIVVVKNPFFTSPSNDGSYRVTGIPAGRHRLLFWREAAAVQEKSVDVPVTGTITVDFRSN